MIARQVSVMYCDDIRQEVTGKNIFIGCYSRDMLVSRFPFTIEKLFCFFTLRLPIDDDAKTLDFCLKINDVIVSKINDVSFDELVSSESDIKLNDDRFAVTEKAISGILNIKGHLLNEPSLITFSVYVDGEELVGQKLRVISSFYNQDN